MKSSVFAVLAAITMVSGCATLTNDANVPVALSFSTGDSGTCKLNNKRQAQEVSVPSVASVRRSDDALRYDCTTSRGKNAVGAIPSSMGSEIVASAVFLDFGITDAITDMHRNYPPSYVIPVTK